MSPFPPWTDLPPELLTTIATHLHSNSLDLLRFRSVCKSWHSSSPPNLYSLSPFIPLTFCPPPFLRSPYFTSFALFVTVIYAFHSPTLDSAPSSWIAFIGQLNPSKVSVRRPFTNSDLVLPLDFPRKINLLDFRVSEIGRFFNICDVAVKDGKLLRSGDFDFGVDKVVALCGMIGLVVLYGHGKLMLLKLGFGVGDGVQGLGNNQWYQIHNGKGYRFDDMVEFNGRMLGVDRRGRVYEMDSWLLQLSLIVPCISGGGGRRKRLIESLGSLYLVSGCRDRENVNEIGEFKVYVLDETVRRWFKVTDIDDRVFIFGLDFSFSALATEFEVITGKNCIIFDECSFQQYCGSGKNRSKPVDLSVQVYRLGDGNRINCMQSCPGGSTILWPPPKWLWLNNKLKLLGFFETVADKLLGKCDGMLKDSQGV